MTPNNKVSCSRSRDKKDGPAGKCRIKSGANARSASNYHRYEGIQDRSVDPDGAGTRLKPGLVCRGTHTPGEIVIST